MSRSKPLSHKREVYVKKEVIPAPKASIGRAHKREIIPAPEASIRRAHKREVLQDSFKNKAVWE